MENQGLQNINEDVIAFLKDLKIKTTVFGGYDKESVLLNFQNLCDIYENYITFLTSHHTESKSDPDDQTRIKKLGAAVAELEHRNKILTEQYESAKTAADDALAKFAEARNMLPESPIRAEKVSPSSTGMFDRLTDRYESISDRELSGKEHYLSMLSREISEQKRLASLHEEVARAEDRLVTLREKYLLLLMDYESRKQKDAPRDVNPQNHALPEPKISSEQVDRFLADFFDNVKTL